MQVRGKDQGNMGAGFPWGYQPKEIPKGRRSQETACSLLSNQWGKRHHTTPIPPAGGRPKTRQQQDLVTLTGKGLKNEELDRPWSWDDPQMLAEETECPLWMLSSTNEPAVKWRYPLWIANQRPDNPDPEGSIEACDSVQLPRNNLPQHNSETPVSHHHSQNERTSLCTACLTARKSTTQHFIPGP